MYDRLYQEVIRVHNRFELIFIFSHAKQDRRSNGLQDQIIRQSILQQFRQLPSQQQLLLNQEQQQQQLQGFQQQQLQSQQLQQSKQMEFPTHLQQLEQINQLQSQREEKWHHNTNRATLGYNKLRHNELFYNKKNGYKQIRKFSTGRIFFFKHKNDKKYEQIFSMEEDFTSGWTLNSVHPFNVESEIEKKKIF